MFRYIKYLLVLISIIVFFSCTENDNQVIVDNNYSFIDLAYEDLFYTYTLPYYQMHAPFEYLADSNGIILCVINDKEQYNPTTISQKGINLFDRFTKTEDSLFLDYAQRHRDALINLLNNEAFFEYRFNWHHRYSIWLIKPWYSGMAQGQALSLLSRLAYYANDTIAHDLANRVFTTLNYNEDSSDEVVCFDNGYAWIEEYPANRPDHTFNGFMFAIIGLYDYYHLLNNSEAVRSVLSAYLTTIHDNMGLFRNPGTISYYCLRHHHSDTTYHQIHIKQLDYFTKITNDSSFTKFADTLRSDYWDY